MTLLLFIKLCSAMVSVALAAGLLARDHELETNRLTAAFLICNAYWATLEFYLFQAQVDTMATALLRWSTMGWMPLGLLFLLVSLSLSSMPDHPISRLTPGFLGASVLISILSVSTDWVIADAIGLPDGGWRPVFGPLFPVAYFLMATPLVTTLACWRGIMKDPTCEGDDRLARIIFVGITLSLIIGTVTAIGLPLLGFEAVGLTTTLVSFVGVLVAWTLRSYGHSLISPEALAREIFDTLDDGVVVLGEDGTIREVNHAFAGLIAVERASAIGSPITTWLPEFPAAVDEFESSILLEVIPASGDRLPVILSAPVGRPAKIRFGGGIFLIRDRREVVSLQRQLAISGRLAAVGDLSKSISESIRTPAVVIQKKLDRLGTDWRELLDSIDAQPSPTESREAAAEGIELISECVEGIDRVIAIVQEVGSFSADSGKETFAPQRFSDIVEAAVRIARAQANPSVDIEMRLDRDVEIECNRSELERVVTNLVVNALHALEGSSRGLTHLTVAVGAQGDRALLHVEDDGCGIPPDVIDRIFDPFFTTKPVGIGTGLGLAISYHIVRKHGGLMRVSSIENRGTSVAVELPRIASRLGE